MTKDVEDAILALHERAREERSSERLEIIDDALNDLVARPERSGDPAWLAGSAMGRAITKRKRRHRIAPVAGRVEGPDVWAVKGPLRVIAKPEVDDRKAHELVQLEDALDRSSLSRRDRGYLVSLEVGANAREVAALDHVGIGAARMRLARASKRALRIWKEAA